MKVMIDTVLRTIIPIFLLIGIGFFSRKMGITKAGDERVFSAYVYYFALPALFFITMAEMGFTSEILMFIFSGITPILVALAIFAGFYFILRFPKNVLFLLILSTIFGSLAFFGIPFVTLAFPIEGERLSTLSAATIATVSVPVSLVVLELHRLKQATKWEGVKQVARRLSRNPLILSILFGVLLSTTRIGIPSPISDALHMLGSTTSVVAIFLLGVFLYGRQYKNISDAFRLSLLRIAFLPAMAFLTTKLFGLSDVEGSVVVLMHGMPTAISMIVLSERYDFYKETIASLILISSLAAALYLNLWLLLLGN